MKLLLSKRWISDPGSPDSEGLYQLPNSRILKASESSVTHSDAYRGRAYNVNMCIRLGIRQQRFVGVCGKRDGACPLYLEPGRLAQPIRHCSGGLCSLFRWKEVTSSFENENFFICLLSFPESTISLSFGFLLIFSLRTPRSSELSCEAVTMKILFLANI